MKILPQSQEAFYGQPLLAIETLDNLELDLASAPDMNAK
jgi:hypothetical protein